MKDCVMCKIIDGEIPSTKVYEDDKVYAFLDISPICPGHTLVIPKNHHEVIEDMPDELLGEVMKCIKKTGKAIKEGLHADGYNIIQNNGKAAGQAVFHVHFHVIPRLEDDGLRHWPRHKYEEGVEQEVLSKIKACLDN